MVMAAASLLSVSSSFLDKQVHFLTLKCQIWKSNRAFIKCRFNHQLLSEKHHEYLHLAAIKTIKKTNQGPESGLKAGSHVPIYRQILGRVHHLGYKIIIKFGRWHLVENQNSSNTCIHTYIHCQRHYRPQTLCTLTHSTHLVPSRSFNKHWNLGPTCFFASEPSRSP